MTAIVDPKKCTACGECIPSCPLDAISKQNGETPVSIDSDICGECGACIDVCPFSAISLYEEI